jgi:uncharacterized protein with HEPN domain
LTDREERYLRYIRDSILRIRRHMPSTFEAFLSDEVFQDMVTWRLQTISDAARNHLSEELRQRHGRVPWRQVFGFRNVAAHGYAGLNLQLIWEIIETDLDALLGAVEAELKPRRPQRNKRRPDSDKHPPRSP